MTRNSTHPQRAMVAFHVRGLFVLLSMAFLLRAERAGAQNYLTTIGNPSFSAAAPVEKGSVNLANGNLRVAIPLATASQRGKYQFTAALVYESRLWHVVTGSSKTWQPTNVLGTQDGWRLATSADTGSTYYTNTNSYCTYMNAQVNYGFIDSGFQWTESSGTVHNFPITTWVAYSTPCSSAGGISTGSAYASDTSGYYMSVTNYNQAVVYAADGTQVNPTVKDPNGNYFSTDSHGNVVDTLGRVQIAKTVNGNTTYYDVLNSQGGTSRYTVTTSTVNVNTNFGQSGVTEYSGSFSAITGIAMPDNTSYSFTYDSGTAAGNFGLLKTMSIPTGGQITYAFTTFQDSAGNRNRWLNSRTAQTGSWNSTWSYAPAVITTCTVGQSTCQQKVTLTQPTGDYVVHTFNLDSSWFGAWDTQQQTYDAHNNLMMSGTIAYDMSHGATYIVPLTSQLSMPVPGGNWISRQTKYTYDGTIATNERINAVKEWGWYSGTSPTYPTTPDRETDTTYVPSYGHITRLPASITVNGTSGMVAQTKLSYDDSTHLTSKTGVVNHDDTNFSTSNTLRGNPTLIQTWVSGTNYLSSNVYYDTTGQVTQTKDPANNSVSYQYGDSNFFSDSGSNPPTAYTPSVVTNAYVTQVTLPITGSKAFGYYFNTGKGAFARDQNGADAYHHFIDPLDRATHSYGPVVNGNRSWVLKTYSGNNQVDVYRTMTDTTASSNCVNCVHKLTQHDGLRRPITTALASDPDGQTNRDKNYDAKGRVQSVSNPYRSTSDATYGTSQPSYDALNRVLGVTLPDGNVQQVFYGSNASTYGLSSQLCSSSTYGLGYPVVTMDEAGNKRQNWKDGFGRLIEVDEPDPTTGTLNLATCYAYNAANNLVSIVQGSQTRTFAYDGLSRLTSHTLPESGTTSYSYTNTSGQLCAGNARAVCSKTDARSVTTTYAYDALNRVTSKSYSDSTPNVTYYYDQTSFNGLTITNGTGRLTGMKETSGGTTLGQTARTYDAAGRILTEQKTVGTVTKSTSYAYNLDGSLASMTYPSGHTVSYTYGKAGRAVSAVDSASNINYAQGATYAPHGMLATATYAKVSGGFAGISRLRTYNNRLQVNEIKDSSSNGVIKDLSYSFNQGSGVNNGMVAAITDNVVAGRSQTYTYDHLRRVASAKTQATSGSDCWGQSFTYDRYRNLTNIGVSQCSAPSLSQAVDVTTNHITSNGFTYDAAGHVTNDGVHTYTWDAEHRMASGAGVTYTYDGLGRRVQKTGGDSSTAMSWYDAQGHLISETDASGNLTNEYIYFGGRRIARREASGTVLYYVNDANNTNRAATNSTGVVQQMSEYYPVGGEKVIVGSVDDRFKFAGNRRDSETGLDYSLQTMYSSTVGSVLQPTPVVSSSPQILNAYAPPSSPTQSPSILYGLPTGGGELNFDASYDDSGYATSFNSNWDAFNAFVASSGNAAAPSSGSDGTGTNNLPDAPLPGSGTGSTPSVQVPAPYPAYPGQTVTIDMSPDSPPDVTAELTFDADTPIYGLFGTGAAGLCIFCSTSTTLDTSGSLQVGIVETDGSNNYLDLNPGGGYSQNVTTNGPTPDQTVLFNVSAGLGGTQYGTSIVRNPDGTISTQGSTLSPGVGANAFGPWQVQIPIPPPAPQPPFLPPMAPVMVQTSTGGFVQLYP